MPRTRVNKAAVTNGPVLYSRPGSDMQKLRKPHPKNEWCEVYGCTPVPQEVAVTAVEAIQACGIIAAFIKEMDAEGKVFAAMIKLRNYFIHLAEDNKGKKSP